jgi:hypothetical protein
MNTKKKSSTKGKTAKEQAHDEEVNGRAVTLNLNVRADRATTDDLIKRWQSEGEVYARLLASNDCPAAFRAAFVNIFTSQLLTKVDATHPAVIGAFFPLVMVALQGNEPCTSDAVVDCLVTLRETLAGELTDRILAELK